MFCQLRCRQSRGAWSEPSRHLTAWNSDCLAATMVLLAFLCCLKPAYGLVCWSDPEAILIFNNGSGRDILDGAVKRDDSSTDTLYFRFHINPQSDSTTEEYFAAFGLYEGDNERLGIGNALKAWAYSAFFRADDAAEPGPAPGYVDLHSSALGPAGSEASPNYELPRRGVERTIVFKVQYVAGGDDLVTVWLDPDLSPGANEIHQPVSLTTRFSADASFDELRLRHGGGGPGWIFTDLAIATTFSDFVDTSSAKPGVVSDDKEFNPGPLSFKSWRRESGMPRKAIRAIAQTRDGYLWIGSDDSLARFDGGRFVDIELRPITGGSGVRALLGGSDGALWIGTEDNGLVRYTGNEFVSFTANNGLPTNSITALAEDEERRLWIGTELGVRVWRDDAIAPMEGLEALDGRHIVALCKDNVGSMWLGVAGLGVFKFETGALTRVTYPETDELIRQVHCLLLDRSGRIWAGAGEDSVLCRENGDWRRFRIPRRSSAQFVTSLAEEADGTVWAGSASEGLFQFKHGRLTAVGAGSGLLDNRISALFLDQGGKLWVGSDSGLSRLQRTHLLALGQGEGLGYGEVCGLAEVAPDVVWAIKPGEGLYRWDGRFFNRLTAAGLNSADSATGAILVTHDGYCWVATTSGVLLFRDPQAVADESRLLALTNANITALAEDVQGSIWAGSREGALWRLARGQWALSASFPGSNSVTAIVPETDGAIWVGTDGGGLFRWKQSIRGHFDKSNGLLSDSIRTLHRDTEGTIWIGTDGGGLSRWRAGRLENFTTQQGLPENTISQIIEDDAGRLWLGGKSGIVCVRKSDFEENSSSRLNSVSTGLLEQPDGLVGDEFSTGFFPSGLKTRSGLLWFSTLKGVVIANPRYLQTSVNAPRVIIEEVLVDGVPLFGLAPSHAGVDYAPGGKDAMPLRITAGRHRIELRYTAPDLESAELLRFRYQLVGLDSDWVEAGSSRSALYNYVPPGEYRFRVAASNGNGEWSESRATLPMVVARHFWQHWWVVLFAAIGVLGSVAVAVRLVEKRKAQFRLRHVEQEHALESERRRIAQDLHDEMGAKLCRISFLSEHAQRHDQARGEFREQINTIADASRELLHTLDEIVWAVNPQNDTLEHVASYINQYAQNYFHGTGVDCELDMPDQFAPHPISSQVRHHLFLAVHEAFTNILKHSGATRATLKISVNASRFEVRIEDNGRGFDAVVHFGRRENDNNCEDGLRNMRDRLGSVGGQCHVDSVPGRGTSIRFLLPLNSLTNEKLKT